MHHHISVITIMIALAAALVIVVATDGFSIPILSAYATPSAINPGQCTDIVVEEENPRLPLNDFEVYAWFPCGTDFEPVTKWSGEKEKGGRLAFSFSGVAAIRKVSTNSGPSFQYDQCYYTWKLPRTNKGHNTVSGAPIVPPHNTAKLTITLCAADNARAGAYDISIGDSYQFPGKTDVRVG